MLDHAALAEGHVVDGDARGGQVDIQEIGPLAFQHDIARRAQAGGQAVAGVLQLRRHLVEPGAVVLQAPGHAGLQVGRGGEGQELMGGGQGLGQGRGGAQKADLPAGHAEQLAGRADLDRPLAHAGEGHQRAMSAAVEDHGLPDLVADGDGVVLDAELCQEGEVLLRRHDGGRVQRAVQHHHPGLVAEGRLQHRPVETPVWGRKADQLGRAARAPDQRQIGVVQRLEQHDLVAR